LQHDTRLLRQIHPSFIQEGRATSQAFRPTAKDNNRLSVYNGSLIDPEASWLHYTEQLRFASAGVLAITYGECITEQLSIIEDGVPFPEHCSIDFSGLESSEMTKKSKKLSALARDRGWLYTR
jgi:hypothetical protein